MLKKIIYTTLSVMFTLALARCNQASDEFNAPSGSTVTFTSTGDSWQFPAKGTPGSCQSGKLALATFVVDVPIGVTTTSGDTTTTAALEPGNKIQGVITANTEDLYKFKAGVTDFLPQSSLVDFVAAGTFPFVTDSRGLYSFAYIPFGCYDTDGALISGSDTIRADIGTVFGALTVSVQ